MSKKRTWTAERWWRILVPLLFLTAFSVLILMERRGVVLETGGLLEMPETITFTARLPEQADCLIITDRQSEASVSLTEEMETTLEYMRVGYRTADVSEVNPATDLAEYRTVVLAFDEWDKMGDGAQDLVKWIQAGGHMMNTMTPVPGTVLSGMGQSLGIAEQNGYTNIEGIRAADERTLGAKGRQEYPFTLEEGQTMEVSLNVQLTESADVLLTDLSGNVPLMWRVKAGDGEVAMINYVIGDKIQRGFLCMAYSLLDDVSIYPVIDASVYYLDDFPSPVPGGNNEYITRDYGIDTASFYSLIWFPRILQWEKEYGIKHTGVIIEMYSDTVQAPFARNKTTARFLNFGNMLLNKGGELGFHGYNHQPLVLAGVDDEQQFGEYRLWNSYEDMVEAVKELKTFSSMLYPGVQFRAYVPPSNIISETGIQALQEGWPEIQAIASVYFPVAGGVEYAQEFGVSENGIINTPRITSGCEIDDFQYMAAFSEINLHFVQSHFMHPDDVLDADRGAELGWEQMAQDFEKYVEYIAAGMPDVRQATGSETASAVLMYDNLSVRRTYEDGKLIVDLGGFAGEASFIVRLNGKTLVSCEGGEAFEEADGVYLIRAYRDQIVICFE